MLTCRRPLASFDGFLFPVPFSLKRMNFTFVNLL